MSLVACQREGSKFSGFHVRQAFWKESKNYVDLTTEQIRHCGGTALVRDVLNRRARNALEQFKPQMCGGSIARRASIQKLAL